MAKTVAIGHQDFKQVITNDYFYIDKTAFIKEWWENGDAVTLITRPRRFGKTLTMSMVEYFFSVNQRGQNDLFSGLSISKNAALMRLCGTYPVISLSFSNIKENSYLETKKKICRTIQLLYQDFYFLLESDCLTPAEKIDFRKISDNMEDYVVSLSLQQLSKYLSKYYQKKVIILLDEYDTPMHEAWINGYWDELSTFIRNLLNATFKGNPYLERAILTGITRISKESIFSDLNHLKVITTTSDEYADCFGFTEQEVYSALGEYGLTDHMNEIKNWYDGFVFGHQTDIYNPWSIINYLDTRKFYAYWANTSSNSLIGKLIQTASKDIKQKFELLMNGETLREPIDEQIIYDQLSFNENAIWSLLLACGYLKALGTELNERTGQIYYELALTNREIYITFANMIRGWFADCDSGYNDFIKALLQDDIDAMNDYMNQVALTTFSFFDAGTKVHEKSEPERFYHGFVLGLMVDLADKYAITSNRESGFGRYDVILEPLTGAFDAIIIEFKVFNPKKEHSLDDTVQNALMQITSQGYDISLKTKGIPSKRIRKYGFAFQGKTVLIKKG